MLKRLKIFTVITVLAIAFVKGANANEKYTANECFEKFSRGTLKFNQTLDRAIFKPIAKGYRVLPLPIRTGTNNFVSNLRSLLSFSNHSNDPLHFIFKPNILQHNEKKYLIEKFFPVEITKSSGLFF